MCSRSTLSSLTSLLQHFMTRGNVLLKVVTQFKFYLLSGGMMLTLPWRRTWFGGVVRDVTLSCKAVAKELLNKFNKSERIMYSFTVSCECQPCGL